MSTPRLPALLGLWLAVAALAAPSAMAQPYGGPPPDYDDQGYPPPPPQQGYDGQGQPTYGQGGYYGRDSYNPGYPPPSGPAQGLSSQAQNANAYERQVYDSANGPGAFDAYWRAHPQDYDVAFGNGASAHDFSAPAAYEAGPGPGPNPDCQAQKQNREVLGGLLGGIAGAVAGSNIAQHGGRTGGAVIGGVLGAGAGAAIGGGTANCN